MINTLSQLLEISSIQKHKWEVGEFWSHSSQLSKFLKNKFYVLNNVGDF